MGSIEMEDLPLTRNDALKSETAADIEESVQTAFGNIKVSIYGDRKMHPIVTFHDIGLDSESSFQNFLQFGAVAKFSEKFCVYNINALGQEASAAPLRENFTYPSLDDMAKQIENVVDHFGFVTFQFGYALILINLVATAAGWIEWGYQKANISYLRSTGMTSFTVDYLMWHHLGKRLEEYNPDLVREYRLHFQNLPNPQNLAYFIESYLQRTPLQFSRDGENGPKLKVPVLQIVGAGSPFVSDTVEVNSRLDPANSSWMKISDSCGLVLDDSPEKVTEAMILFLQGLGYRKFSLCISTSFHSTF
ncbi:unnamed protein product [Enterobius vermicularis]|uniref:NDRG3 n=1 Tax=Enterobius vermicularis TaxID=51028 RepID=A0A0N4UX17_ENTVE|nr:unnamed protein product [Enterobius vermicularis]